MHIRLAKPSDEPALAELCSRAFVDEDLFGRVMNPHRAQYPEDFKLFWREWLRPDWADKRSRMIVAVDETAAGEKNVLGVAVWQRQGNDAGAEEVQRSWVDLGAWPPAENRLNRAGHPDRRDILARTGPFTQHIWEGKRADTWYLALCCVDPAVSGKGAGRALVEWGLNKARAEGVCASVTSSDGNGPFYLKCGFDEVVGNACAGEGNPLGELNTTGGDVLFMWPEGFPESEKRP